MGKVTSLRFRNNGTASANAAGSRLSFSIVLKMVLVVVLILAAVSTQVQKQVLSSSTYSESGSPVHKFSTTQTYSDISHESPRWQQDTGVVSRQKNNIGSGDQKQVNSKSRQESEAIDLEDEMNDVSSFRPLAEVPGMKEVEASLRKRRNEVVANNPTINSLPQKRQAWYDQLEARNEPHPELGYAPQRIPGYLKNSGRTLFGFVMRDLTTRIMSRGIAQSSILVVSSDAPSVVRLLQSAESGKKTEEELREHVNHTVGGSTLIHAKAQNHAVIGLYDGLASHSISVNEWWQHLGESSFEPRPSWFLVCNILAFPIPLNATGASSHAQAHGL